MTPNAFVYLFAENSPAAMIQTKILAAYESLAESYNALIDHKPHNAYYDRPNTLSLLPEVNGKQILDAGCGPGKYAEILLAQGAQITGLDMSPKMIALAKERNKSQGQFMVHDLSTPLTMFPDGAFDIVLSPLVLDYLPDWTLTIQEFYRVLQPKGLLVISVQHPFGEYLFNKSEKYFEVEHVYCTWRGFGHPVEVHCYRRSLGDILSPLTSNGFYIDTLLEPRPTAEFESLDPRHFKELNAFPAFMCIRAIKRA